MKIVKSYKTFDLLMKGIGETVNNEAKEQKIKIFFWSVRWKFIGKHVMGC